MSQELRTRIIAYRQNLESRKVNQLKLDLLLRQTDCLIQKKTTCVQCAELINQIETKFGAVQNNEGWRIRHQYLQAIANLSTHLREKHRLYPRGETESNWIGLGMVAGMLTGLLIFHDFVPGFFIGLAAGVIIGILREKILIKQNRVY